MEYTLEVKLTENDKEVYENMFPFDPGNRTKEEIYTVIQDWMKKDFHEIFDDNNHDYEIEINIYAEET